MTDQPSTLPGPAATDSSSGSLAKALASGNLADLHDSRINLLIQQAANEVDRNGVMDELGALRLVLTRLVNEQQDLDALTANVTRVASVALQAARTQRLIGEGATAMIGGAVGEILAEVRKDWKDRNNRAKGSALPEPD